MDGRTFFVFSVWQCLVSWFVLLFWHFLILLLSHPCGKVCSDTYQCRTVPPPDDTGMDFDDDLTELETFGATTKLSRTCKMETTFPAATNTAKILSHGLKMEGKNSSTINKGDEEEKNTLSEQEGSACASVPLPSLDGTPRFSLQEHSPCKSFQSAEVGLSKALDVMTNEVLDNEAKLNPLSVAVSSEKEPDAVQKKETYTSSCGSDTDEERLVIDSECETTASCKSAETARSPCPIQSPLAIISDCSDTMDQGKKASKKLPRKLSKELDPVGQILKMQTELLKSPSQKAHEPVVSSDNSNAVPAQLPQSPQTLVASSTETVPAPASNPPGSSRNTWTWLFESMPKSKCGHNVRRKIELSVSIVLLLHLFRDVAQVNSTFLCGNYCLAHRKEHWKMFVHRGECEVLFYCREISYTQGS